MALPLATLALDSQNLTRSQESQEAVGGIVVHHSTEPMGKRVNLAQRNRRRRKRGLESLHQEPVRAVISGLHSSGFSIESKSPKNRGARHPSDMWMTFN